MGYGLAGSAAQVDIDHSNPPSPTFSSRRKQRKPRLNRQERREVARGVKSDAVKWDMKSFLGLRRAMLLL